MCILVSAAACGQEKESSVPGGGDPSSESSWEESTEPLSGNDGTQADEVDVPDDFIRISGGMFQMGSPDSESWRSDDETQHEVSVSNFYMCRYEVTQAEYGEIMGRNPSNFMGGELPVENVSWTDAVAFCNARSEKEGLTPFNTENSISAEEANYYGRYPYEISDRKAGAGCGNGGSVIRPLFRRLVFTRRCWRMA